MKLYVLASHIQKKLGFLNKAISPRSQLPVLLNIALITNNGKLQLKTTDLEIGVQVEIPANVEEEGEVTVPAKTFSELVASFNSDEKIIMTTDNTTLHVSTGKTKSILPTIPIDDFPNLFEEKGEEQAVFPKELFINGLFQVIFAASSDIARPALSGVLLAKQKEKNEMLFVATDGYRLSLKQYKNLKAVLGDSEEKELLIPARIMKEIVLLKDEDGDIRLFISGKNNQVIFEQGETMLIGRLIEAQYPPYQKIIPQDFITRVQFDKEEMHQAVKMCAIFAREAANIIKLSVAKDKIVVSANSPSVGENTVEVAAKVSGEEDEIAFNARYLLELFSHLEEEEVVFEMSGPLSPGVFKVKDDPTFLHLIMPIRVQG
ncbi:MAG: DNA polymerase III subunit beta [Candidatus Levybacteria bacterium]|nr:DNA polymerase III subunit beta [Candidatus Levybacteria bacterium]